jgi:hypothetical protein
MTEDDWDAEGLADEQLLPGEEGWIRGDDGKFVWVYVNPDGTYQPTTPPTLTPPEAGKPIFPSDGS